MNDNFSWNAFCAEIHADNQQWWRDPATGERMERNLGELLMLTVSEVAEAMEGERKSLMDTHLHDRKMAEVELADVVIRIADIAGSRNLDIDFAFGMTAVRLNDCYTPENKGEALYAIVAALACDAEDDSLAVRLSVALYAVQLYAKTHGYDLWGAIADKREYNRHRADHK